MSPLLFQAEYDPLTAFEPIGLFGTAPTVVITYPNSKYKTLKDVVDAAKAKPGEMSLWFLGQWLAATCRVKCSWRRPGST